MKSPTGMKAISRAYRMSTATAGNAENPLQQRIQAASQALAFARAGRHMTRSRETAAHWLTRESQAQAQLNHLNAISDTLTDFLRTQDLDLLSTVRI